MIMKVLVTGHLGYIGTILVKLLKEAGHEVVGLDTGYFRDCVFYTDDIVPPDQELVIDLRSIDAKHMEGIDAVCHLAALSNDPMGEINPGLTMDINAVATASLAKTAKRAGASRFLYSSSCSMYGKSGQTTVDENDPLAPLTPYAKSKVESEKSLAALVDDGFTPVYLRNSTAYGLSPRLRLDLVLNNLAAWAFLTKSVRIMSDGTPWRPLIHAEDIARAFVALLDAPTEKVANQAFNIGDDTENYQIRTIAETVAELTPGSALSFSDTPDLDSRSYRVSFAKLRTHFPDFKLKWNLRSAAEQLLKAFNEHGLPKDALESRTFIRLKQLRHLIDDKLVDDNLRWN